MGRRYGVLWGLGLLLLPAACTRSVHPTTDAGNKIPFGMPIEEAVPCWMKPGIMPCVHTMQ